jgi:hypothetical protein
MKVTAKVRRTSKKKEKPSETLRKVFELLIKSKTNGEHNKK